MTPRVTWDVLRAAVNLPHFDAAQAHFRMASATRVRIPPTQGTPPRKAGVLILVYPEADGLHLILTRRSENLRGHSGQISFPGGSRDPEDTSLSMTALRETCEELGICDEDITVIGALSQIYIPPTHFDVYPTVAIMTAPPTLRPNPDEVAAVFSFALDSLIDEANKHWETRDVRGVTIEMPVYHVGDNIVWGATAMMLSELEMRLRAVLDGE